METDPFRQIGEVHIPEPHMKVKNIPPIPKDKKNKEYYEKYIDYPQNFGKILLSMEMGKEFAYILEEILDENNSSM